MARRLQTKSKTAPFLRVLLLAVGATALLSIMLGYLAGTYNSAPSWSGTAQDEFITGVVLGAKISEEPDAKVRCAAEFYPDQPAAMTGCLQGITRPPQGYRLPQ